MAEREIQHAIRLALGQDSRVILWRNNVGVLEDKRGQKVRYGLCVGSSDLIGILRESGRFVALEIKTAKGRVDEDQELFLGLVRRCGGFAAVVRSVDEALAAIGRAAEGANQ
jgi:hypothetical protein